MKRYVKYFLWTGLIITVSIPFAYYLGKTYTSTGTAATMSSIPAPPGRLIQNGPYGTGVIFSDMSGEYRLQLKADRLFVTKTKLLGFDNALLKKAVAERFSFTVFKKGKKVLEIAKKHQEMPLNMNRFDIRHPEILFPKNGIDIDAVEVNRSKGVITLHHKNGKIETWQLKNDKAASG